MATKKITNKKSVSKIDSIKKFFGSVTENVIEGATLVTETIKDNSAKAYVASTELVEEANQRIHLYTDKISLEKEEKNIIKRQKEIFGEFGEKSLSHYVKNESLHKAFLNTKSISELVDEFKGNQKNLNSISKKLKQLNK